jgi:hypothetical protein
MLSVMMVLVRMLVPVIMLLSPELFTREVFLAVDDDVDLSGRDPVAQDLREFQFGADVQGADGLAQQVGRNASIDKGAEKHVATDPAETIEVGNAKGRNTRAAGHTLGVRTTAETFIIGVQALRVKPAHLL